MPHDIDALKSAQDELDRQRNALLDKFIPFRDQLVTRLEQFTNESVEKGLRGVTLCKIRKSTREFLEATLELNDFELVIVSNGETYPLNWEDKSLAAKILIYRQGDDKHTPLVEVVFTESKDQLYKYLVKWFAQSEAKHVTGARSVNESSGQQAAGAVLDHFYRFENIWAEKPTLGAILKSETEKHALGFKHHP